MDEIRPVIRVTSDPADATLSRTTSTIRMSPDSPNRRGTGATEMSDGSQSVGPLSPKSFYSENSSRSMALLTFTSLDMRFL